MRRRDTTNEKWIEDVQVRGAELNTKLKGRWGVCVYVGEEGQYLIC